jgi:hypothetical protein
MADLTASDVVDKTKGGIISKYKSDTFFAFHEVRNSFFGFTMAKVI